MTAEVGRQPWLIYGLMRTAEGASPLVSAGNGLFTLLGFMGMYTLLGSVPVPDLARGGFGPGPPGLERSTCARAPLRTWRL